MSKIEGELVQLGNQLMQVQMAIASVKNRLEKNELITLKEKIKELAETEVLDTNEKNEKPTSSEESIDISPIAKISALKLDDFVDELKSMEGMRCRAPYTYAWSESPTYHNALIFRVEDIDNVTEGDNIKVRVMFINPTRDEMLPCPFYVDGTCRFVYDECKYSHGEEVFLNNLKAYREPDIENIKVGKRVLAKKRDGLWHEGTITSIGEILGVVKFDSNSEEEVLLQYIVPFAGGDWSDEGWSEQDFDPHQKQTGLKEENMRMLMAPQTSSFGEWEKFTKGVGSSIMKKMGYVYGSGLGKDGTGRVDPVPVVILPARTSLDHCMMLRKESEDKKKQEKSHNGDWKMLSRMAFERVDVEGRDFYSYLFKPLGRPFNSGRLRAYPTRLGNGGESDSNALGSVRKLLRKNIKEEDEEIASLKYIISKYYPNTKK